MVWDILKIVSFLPGDMEELESSLIRFSPRLA